MAAINSMVTELLYFYIGLLRCYVRQKQRLIMVITLVTLHCTMPAVMDTFR